MVKYSYKDNTHIIDISANRNYLSLSIINDFIKAFYRISKTESSNVKIVLPYIKKDSKRIHFYLVLAGVIQYYKEHNNFSVEIVASKGNISIDTLFNVENVELNRSIFGKIITFKGDKEIHDLGQLLVNQMKYHYKCGKQFLPSLSWCVKEILDNIMIHSGSDEGLFLSTYNNEKHRLTVAVLDQGKGIKFSFRKNEKYIINSDSDAIEKVLEKGVSGDNNGQGIGMWGLKEILKQSNGNLYISSGKQALRYAYKNNECVRNDLTNMKATISKENPGTLVAFSIDIRSNIDIETIFGSYPLYERINAEIENMEIEDGFIDFIVKKEAINGTSTRGSGRELRNYILNIYQTTYGIILIDFEGLETISSAFADEMIAKMLLFMSYNEFSKRIRITNANEFISKVITQSVETRKIGLNKRKRVS